jgi:lipid-binding SYLF domain-containing protein
LGGNLAIAAGPIGREIEASGAVRELAPVYSYSKTKGAYAGISFEGSVLVARQETNKGWYGECKVKDVLAGRVERPAEVYILSNYRQHIFTVC